MVYIGIDNGVTGSIGIIEDDGRYTTFKTPVKKELNYTKKKSFINRIDAPALQSLLINAIGSNSAYAMLERPMVNPTRFVASSTALRAFEATIVILETLAIGYEVIDSKVWQKELLPHGVSGDELKTASLSVGNRVFPGLSLLSHPDRDGILIAEYCRRQKR